MSKTRWKWWEIRLYWCLVYYYSWSRGENRVLQNSLAGQPWLCPRLQNCHYGESIERPFDGVLQPPFRSSKWSALPNPSAEQGAMPLQCGKVKAAMMEIVRYLVVRGQEKYAWKPGNGGAPGRDGWGRVFHFCGKLQSCLPLQLIRCIVVQRHVPLQLISGK